MGMKDTETKRYISNPDIFADAFNYLLYNGRQVIAPSSLKPVDTTEIAVPYGNGAKTPIQKYRDNMKIWAAMYDGKAVYVLLGSENQSSIHYAMPVKDMLYDGINYAAQVDAARASYKGFQFDENGVRITYTSDEFLSGFHKNDKLIPVITAVIYFGAEEWDAPMSIHEMLDVDPALLPFIPDYRIIARTPVVITTFGRSLTKIDIDLNRFTIISKGNSHSFRFTCWRKYIFSPLTSALYIVFSVIRKLSYFSIRGFNISICSK